MAKKKNEITQETKEIEKELDTQEELDEIDELEEETKKEKILTIKEILKEAKEKRQRHKKDKRRDFILMVFIKNLIENRLYLISFIITIIFFACTGVNKVKNSEGLIIPVPNNDIISTQPVKKENPTTQQKEEKPEDKKETEEIDITDYVGIYSRDITLNETIQLNDTCTLDTYKIVYQVNKNNTISKYITSTCLGTIKIWDDNVTYNQSGGAKYISAKNTNFIFGNKSLKELDGETFKIDDAITSLKESNKTNSKLYFYNSDIIIMTNDNLYQLKGNTLAFKIKDEYTNNGGDLTERFYKPSNKNQFNFIVFSNGESNVCYTEVDNKNEIVYTLYQIKYDETTQTFKDVQKVLERTKETSCDNYKDDLKTLQE